MKARCRPGDFRAEEVLRLRLKPRGSHTVCQLDKRYWNTLDVIRDLEANRELRRLSRAGLKDRYSVSTQFLSLPDHGPAFIREDNYSLRRVGMTNKPVSREVLLGNRFRDVMRDLSNLRPHRLCRTSLGCFAPESPTTTVDSDLARSLAAGDSSPAGSSTATTAPRASSSS